MSRHLAVDIDGTLTRGERDAALNPRVFDVLREWGGAVVVATGKVLPNALALCNYVGIPLRTIAENGGVIYIDGEYVLNGDNEAAWSCIEEYISLGHQAGWGEPDLVNKWRETEVAVNIDQALDPLKEVADRHGLEVVDTGYAYHVKSPGVDKGTGMIEVCEVMDCAPEDFVAVGDSENDASLFEVVGDSYAVANSDDLALESANHVTQASYADGFLEAVEDIQNP